MALNRFCLTLYAAILPAATILPVAAAAQLVDEPALVDPTRPVAFVAPTGTHKEVEKKLILQAIFSGSGRHEAVINGQTVKVGEFVDQAKILAIGPGRVSFVKNGEKGELVLLPTVSHPVRVEE